uniref:Uncharacterized protein n=1 Tax=Tetranychus urticae TaxID=32264 RepID=T1K5P6_TETUR
MFSGRKILRSPEDEENATLTYYDFKNFQLNVNGTHGNLNDPFVTIDVPTLVRFLRENVVKVIDHATLYKPIYLISGFMFAIVAVALGYFKYHQICPTNCSARFRKFISRFRGKIDKPIFKKSKESNQIL